MSKPVIEPTPKKVTTTYDDVQHCTALRQPHGNVLDMDCPYTGKGEEFSPGDLLEAALAGCMLLSMGALAVRRELDITGAQVHVKAAMGSPPTRIGSIDVTVSMPTSFPEADRVRLERAAEACPIKHSFAEDIPVSVRYEYPD